jgi:hypothetical protein
MTQFKRSASIGLSIAAFTSSAVLFMPTAWALPSGTYSAVITVFPPRDRPIKANTCVRFARGGVFADATFASDNTTRQQNGVWSATKLSAKRWQATLSTNPISYNGSTPNRNTIKADGIGAGRSGSRIVPIPITLTGKKVSRCSVSTTRSLSEMFPNLQILPNFTEEGPAVP